MKHHKHESFRTKLISCSMAILGGTLFANLVVNAPKGQNFRPDKYLNKVVDVLFNLSLTLHRSFDTFNGYNSQFESYHNEYHVIAVSNEIIELVKHLILETTFDYFDSQSPSIFGTFMRVVDQIGSGYFNPNLFHVIGLLRERNAENPENGATFNPDFSFNFIYRRLPQLVHDKNVCDFIIDIFQSYGGFFPNESIHSLCNQTIKVSDFLKHWDNMLTNSLISPVDLLDQKEFMYYVRQASNACTVVA